MRTQSPSNNTASLFLVHDPLMYVGCAAGGFLLRQRLTAQPIDRPRPFSREFMLCCQAQSPQRQVISERVKEGSGGATGPAVDGARAPRGLRLTRGSMAPAGQSPGSGVPRQLFTLRGSWSDRPALPGPAVGAGARGDLSAANPARNGEVGPIERGAHSLAAAVLRVAGERPNGDGFFHSCSGPARGGCPLRQRAMYEQLG